LGRIVILEPPGSREAYGGISGGFLYNDRLGLLGSSDVTLGPEDLVLFDSLFWYSPEYLATLPQVSANQPWGIILHGLPPDTGPLFESLGKTNLVILPSLWIARKFTQELKGWRPTYLVEEDLETESKFGLPRNLFPEILPLIVLYPGWDTHGPELLKPRRRTLPEKLEEYRFASLGRVSEGKGHNLAAEALALLELPSWSWIAAGPGNRELEHTIYKKLGSKFETPGTLPSEEVPDFLHTIDVLIQPSLAETFSMAVYEAAAAGCGVVALDRGGVSEALALGQALRAEVEDEPSWRGRRSGILVTGDEDTSDSTRVLALSRGILEALEPVIEQSGLRPEPRPELQTLLSWEGRRRRLNFVVSLVLQSSFGGMT